MLHQLLDSAAGRTLVLGPRLGTERLVPLQERLERSAVGEPGAAHPQVLHQTQVLHLVTHDLRVELVCKREGTVDWG